MKISLIHQALVVLIVLNFYRLKTTSFIFAAQSQPTRAIQLILHFCHCVITAFKSAHVECWHRLYFLFLIFADNLHSQQHEISSCFLIKCRIVSACACCWWLVASSNPLADFLWLVYLLLLFTTNVIHTSRTYTLQSPSNLSLSEVFHDPWPLFLSGL